MLSRPGVLLLILATAGAALASGVQNGGMEGPPTDHSEGRAMLVTPAGWTPVNIDANRGDRLSVEPSDRKNGGQCLHVKTFSMDAGVYQTVTPLQKGATYLLSAWVKRLVGQLAVEAYPYAWGPWVTRRVDGSSQGWTRLVVGLTPIDEGAHVYLVASPQADFLIDDVEIRPASVVVRGPTLQPYDFTDTWRYRVVLSCPPEEGGPPGQVFVRPVSSEGSPIPGQSQGQRVDLGPARPTAVEFRLPFVEEEALFSMEVTDAAGREVLGSSSLTPLAGSPWNVQYPYKDSLFASTGWRWPVRVFLRHAPEGALKRLRATTIIQDKAGKILRSVSSRAEGESLLLPLSGAGLHPGEYRLGLSVQEGKGRTVYRSERPLRILPPGPHEVVCAPNGQVWVDGRPFFPIGLYWVFANPADWKPGPARKDAEFRELRQAGFNTLHTYAFEHNDENDTDENAIAYLNTAQEFGFKVMMGLRRDWYQGQDLNLAAIEQRVRALKDHPALLGWTLWDEPNFDPGFSLLRLRPMYDLITHVDPYHPAMPVFGGPGGRSFRECTDVNLFDCYPGAGGAGTLPAVLRRAREGLSDKPVWFVAQGFRSGGRLPSEEDMRLFVRHALRGGAHAIFFYSYGGGGTDWDSVRTEPEHWERVKRVVSDLAHRVAPKEPKE